MYSDPKLARLMAELEGDPLLERMFRAAMGQAPAEELAAWRNIAQMFAQMLPKIERMLARYEPEARPAKLQQILDDWLAEERAKHPTRH
jgi:hypothetical protein